MWQTELNIYLQSFSSTYLTNLFKFITNIGSEPAAITISIVILFGVNIRTGFILIQVCTLSHCINDALKIIFALPRPVSVDSNVQILWKNKPNTTPLTSMGAKKFLSVLPQETIDYFRTHKLGSYGFPSGTSTRAISFWGMIYSLYKKAWVRVVAVLFILLIPLSRMYYGRHFLADVLGSFFVSFTIIGVFYVLIYKNKNLVRFLFDEKGLKINKQLIILIIYLFVLPFTLLMIPKLTRLVMGPLLGINAGYLILRFQGFPKDTGSLKHRLARVIVAGTCYFFFVAGLQMIIKDAIALETQSIIIGVKALGVFLFIWSAMRINIRLGFFKY
ncbi:MAG: phosphatase PAP2 family protein [Deltaproteobacteria bacterium]|nr:phosphatase PAP2 family protein [Deltaproteobacteria bacterium]